MLCWIDHVWSSKECVCCACDPNERLDERLPIVRRGGGVGVLINNHIKHQSRILHDKSEITSFESIEVVITLGSITIRLSVIYRMPPVKSKNGVMLYLSVRTDVKLCIFGVLALGVSLVS